MTGVERATNADGKEGVYITFKNEGRAHGYVSGTTIELESDQGWSQTIGSDTMGSSVGLGLVPAQADRDLFVPLDNIPADGRLSGTLRSGASG